MIFTISAPILIKSPVISMSLNLSGISAATLSYGSSPYPLPNFNFAWSAGADGIQFLREDIASYYLANSDQAYIIFKNGAGVDPVNDPVFLVAQDLVGFPESGQNSSAAFPNLYFYESQIGQMPGALSATLSIQGLRDYFYSQADAFGLGFTQQEVDLINEGFTAYIARYAAVLNGRNLAETGSSLTASEVGFDYVDVWGDIAGIDAEQFYSSGANIGAFYFQPSEQSGVSNKQRFETYTQIFKDAASPSSTYSQTYQSSPDSYSPYANVKEPGFQIASSNPPTVFQSLLPEFLSRLRSGFYNGHFADGGLKIEAGVRSLLEAGVDANPLFTGQGFGYSSNGSPTAPLGLDRQTILERIPGYEFSAFNTFVNQYSNRVTTKNSSPAAQGQGVQGSDIFNPEFLSGSGYFPEGSPALKYNNFSNWNITVNRPKGKFVSQDIFPTPKNESLQPVQFFEVGFDKAGLLLEMPETPITAKLVLSSIDPRGFLDEDLKLPGSDETISDVFRDLGKRISNFARSSIGDDVIIGSKLNDFIGSKAGNDKILGLCGDDIINTGSGYDIAILGDGKDKVLITKDGMKGAMSSLSYLTLPDFHSEDSIAIEKGITFEVLDRLTLSLKYKGFEKKVTLSGSSTLSVDASGKFSDSIGWNEIIANKQIDVLA